MKSKTIIKGKFANKYTIFSDGSIYSERSKKFLRHDVQPTSVGNRRVAYHRVNLFANGHSKHFAVHRLVAMAFVENDDPKFKVQVDHIDGNRDNNDYTNLEWVTPEENMRRCIKDKKHVRGVDHYRSKYTVEQIRMVKQHHVAGISRKESSKMTGVTMSTIKDIRMGKSWKDIN